MFRAKTTRRNVKRATSPLRPATDLPADVVHDEKGQGQGQDQGHVQEKEQKDHKADSTLEKKMVNFFDAESAAVSLSKPWLRLERGIRLQKYRAFAESFPSLNADEKLDLYKVLLKANDAKLLNTKQHVQYENGVIQSVKGLKVVNTETGKVFKIDMSRPTKKNTDEPHP